MDGKIAIDLDKPFFLSRQQLGLDIKFPQDEYPGYGFQMAKLYRLSGGLDLEAISRSIDVLVERHLGLRTTVKMVRGNCLQEVQSSHLFRAVVQDFSQKINPEEDAKKVVQNAVYDPFNLSCDLPLRCTLIKVARDQSILAIVLHHAMGDGWSMDLIIKELSSIYSSLCASGKLPVMERPAPYGDYCKWQKGWINSSDAKSQLNYWRGQLAGTFPFHRTEKLQQTISRSISIDEELGKAIFVSCRKRAVTPSMLFLTVFKCVIARATGENDIKVIIPMAGRSQPDYWNTVGFFSVLGIFHTCLPKSRDFDKSLKSVRHIFSCGYANQDAALLQQEIFKRIPFVVHFNFLYAEEIADRFHNIYAEEYAWPEPLADYSRAMAAQTPPHLGLYCEVSSKRMEVLLNSNFLDESTANHYAQMFKEMLLEVVDG